jgi:aspartate aminotransferase-like enzyme
MRYSPPKLASLDAILPDEPLLMMGAGPVPIPAKVASANSIVINHLGETMNRIIEQVKTMASYVFQTRTGRVLGVAGPASAAMEMAICNLVEPGTRVVSVINGYFSERLAEMSQRCGAEVRRLALGEIRSVSLEEIEAELKAFRPEVLTLVQGETSVTVENRGLPEICALARRYDCLVVVDAVCTLSTIPLEMDSWGADAVITGGQKGLSSIPGVSLLAFSEQAWRRIETRNAPIAHWCLDARLADRFWYGKSYHYTAPVSGILALHEALHLICIETLEARFQRHRLCSQALQQGLEAMGLTLFVPPESRLASVLGIKVPGGVSGNAVREHMSNVYGVEIAGSFGHDILRIGQMGEQCRAHAIFRTLHALGSSINTHGGRVDVPAGMAALEAVLMGGQLP